MLKYALTAKGAIRGTVNCLMVLFCMTSLFLAGAPSELEASKVCMPFL